MNSQFSSSTTLLVFLFCILIGLINKPPCHASTLYENCSTNFACGNINVAYPFWGENRDRACGYDQLNLTCENGLAKINIASVKYRLLNYYPETQVMQIARDDYATNGLCSSKYANTTLDPALFELVTGSDYVYINMTLFYGCPGSANIPGHFTCTGSGTSSTDGYVTTLGAVVPVLCSMSVVVPVYSQGLGLGNISDSSIIEDLLRRGFEVRLKVDTTSCNECIESKGVCGYDDSVNKTTCYCENGTSVPKTCPSPATADAPQGPATNGS